MDAFSFAPKDVPSLLTNELIYQLAEAAKMPYEGQNIPSLASLRYKGESCRNYVCGKFVLVDGQFILVTAATPEGEVLLMVDCQHQKLQPAALVFEDGEHRQLWLNNVKISRLAGEFAI